MSYTIPRVLSTGSISSVAVLRNSDSALIPRDGGNSDYQAFLAWQAAGNTASTQAAAPVVPTPSFISAPDNTRDNKLLSFEMLSFAFYGGNIAADDYFILHSQTQATASYAMPYDATLVRIGLYVGNTQGNAMSVSVYVENTETANAAQVAATPSTAQRIAADLNIDVAQGQIVRLRLRGSASTAISDVVASLYFRWRASA